MIKGITCLLLSLRVFFTTLNRSTVFYLHLLPFDPFSAPRTCPPVPFGKVREKQKFELLFLYFKKSPLLPSHYTRVYFRNSVKAKDWEYSFLFSIVTLKDFRRTVRHKSIQWYPGVLQCWKFWSFSGIITVNITESLFHRKFYFIYYVKKFFLSSLVSVFTDLSVYVGGLTILRPVKRGRKVKDITWMKIKFY